MQTAIAFRERQAEFERFNEHVLDWMEADMLANYVSYPVMHLDAHVWEWMQSAPTEQVHAWMMKNPDYYFPDVDSDSFKGRENHGL